MRVALVEGWFRGSHRAWAEAVRTHSRHRVELVTHTGANWHWRLQGSAVTLAPGLTAAVERLGGLDALVTTSSVPVAALVGLARRTVGSAPVVHYLHENQLTYPADPSGAPPDLTYPMIDWHSLVAADVVVANSAHHRDVLLGALPSFLRRFPAPSHLPALDQVADRFVVVPPGVDRAPFVAARRPDRDPVVAWVHRWEHDKHPDRFVRILARVAGHVPEVRAVVLGSGLDRDRVAPDLAPVRDRVAHLGEAPRADYARLLGTAAVVVSTARHEFAGIAVAEAMTAGCVPVVPDALAYPELVPAGEHTTCLYRDDDTAVERIVTLLSDRQLRERTSAAVAGATVDVRTTIGSLDDVIERAVEQEAPGPTP